MAETFDNPLERYQIMDPLGQGGSGRTFRAVDRSLGRQVAVKVLSLRDMPDWKRFDLFEREAAVLGTLDHPGIPRYIDRYSSEASGDYFLVMELIDGHPLSDRIVSGGRFPPKVLLDMLEQTLGILEYLHGLSPPVIHRDIKPANLVIDGKGMVHLVDFGGVRHAARASGNTTMIGSFGYMAPEQLHGEATAASDLYALGATIAALHAGVEADQLPHDGLHIDLAAIELPAALTAALTRMLEPNPKSRAASVAQVRRAMAQPKPLPPSPSPPSGGPSSTKPPRQGGTPPAGSAAPLVPVQGIRDLARVPAPLSVVVWIFSALAAGSLTVFQVLMLPLIFQVARFFNRKESAERQTKLEGDLEKFESTVAEARRSLAHVAGSTHPIRDSDDDPPKR